MENDFPFAEMLEAADGKIGADAVFAALRVLYRNQGSISLPLNNYSSWTPLLPPLIRRARFWLKKKQENHHDDV